MAFLANSKVFFLSKGPMDSVKSSNQSTENNRYNTLVKSLNRFKSSWRIFGGWIEKTNMVSTEKNASYIGDVRSCI